MQVNDTGRARPRH